MIYTRTQRQEAYRKLSAEVQSFAMALETSETIDNILNLHNFNENQLAMADGEIFSAMLGLQTLKESLNNIARNTNKSVGEFIKLEEQLQKEVFDKIELIKYQGQKEGANKTEELTSPQISPVIAPEIHPMVEEGEVAHDVPRSTQSTTTTQPAASTPPPHTPAEPTPAPPPMQDTYPQGQDPYREPVE